MTVARRSLGPDGPRLSQLAFGTMRLDGAAEGDQARAAELLCHLHDLGVDTHHSSFEYESHQLYLAALALARSSGRTFQHIVKLSEPGYQDTTFDPARLTARLDEELTTLGTESIASLQWLFRTPDASATANRIDELKRQHEEIRDWFREQRRAGKIGNVSVFPYASPFARAVMDLDVADTLATYLNLAELDYVSTLDRAAGFIAIRPLAGGRLVQTDPQPDDLVDPRAATRYLATMGDRNERLRAAVRFPLLHPRVATTVVSVSSRAHIDSLIAAGADQEADEAEFNQIVAELTARHQESAP